MRFGAPALVTAAIVATALSTAASPVEGQADGSAPGSSAITDCVRSEQSLSVLFLVDSSQSLAKTDPAGQRVVGLTAAVEALGAIAAPASEEGMSPPSVFVEVADFGTTTRRAFPDRPLWAALEGENKELIDRLREFSTRNDSEDTDYVGALEPWFDRDAPNRPADEQGAIELLELAPEGSCRLLLWFTDGEFDIDYQRTPKMVWWAETPINVDSDAGEAAIEARGEVRLCGPDSLVDELRSGELTTGAGAFVIVVALGDTSNFDLIRSIAEGGPIPCGSEPPRGELLEATSLGGLIYALATGPNPNESAIAGDSLATCTGAAASDDVELAACELAFELTPTISAFNLLTLAGAAGVSTVVVPTLGEPILLTDSRTLPLANGATLDIRRLGDAGDVFQVSADLPEDGSWAGTWRLRFVSEDEALAREAVNKAAMYLFVRSLTAELREAVPLRAGRTGKVTVQLVNPSNEPATDTSFVTGSEIEVFANGELAELGPLQPDGTFAFDYEVPLHYEKGEVVITAILRPIVRLNDDAPPVPLPEWSGELGRLEVLPIPKFPLVDPIAAFDRALDQDNLEVRSSLRVDATGDDAGGCVRLVGVEDRDSGLLDGDASVEFRHNNEVVDPNAECPIELEQGEEATVEIVVSVDADQIVDPAETVVSGRAVFESTGQLEPVQSERFDLPYRAAVQPMNRPTTDPVAYWLVLAALIVPLLLLYAASAWAARLVSAPSGHFVRRVIYSGGRFLDEETGKLLAFASADLENVGNPEVGRYRNLTLAGFDFDARMPFNPFGDVWARVTRAGSPFVVGDFGTDPKPCFGRTPVVMTKAWAFASDSLPVRAEQGDERVENISGTLLIVVPPIHTTAIPYVTGRLPEISETVDRAAARHAVDPQIAPESPSADAVAGSGMDTDRSSETLNAARSQPIDPFALTDSSGSIPFDSADRPATSDAPASRRSRKPKRSKRERDSGPAGLPDSSESPPDGPALPF